MLAGFDFGIGVGVLNLLYGLYAIEWVEGGSQEQCFKGCYYG